MRDHVSGLTDAALEAERRVVQCCCDDPKAIELIECNISDFGHPKWRACVGVLLELYSQDKVISDIDLTISVQERFKTSVGLEELTNVDGFPSMVGAYSRTVAREAARRRLFLGLSALRDRTVEEPPEAILASLSELARESSIGTVTGGVTVAELVKERFAEYAEIADRRSKGEEGETGFSTGIEKLDEVLGGLQPGIVTLLAARPSMGKSTVALNITANATRDGIGVHVFSLEEPRAAYADRVVSLASRVSTEKLRNVALNAGEFGQVRNAADKVYQRTGWIIDDRTGARADEVVRCVRLHAAENRTRIVVIDYINILKRNPGERKMDMMDEAINVFADAAKRDGMAYLVLAQLNRGLENRDNPEPRLSDLKECGTLEERAKAVIMLHHPSEHDSRAPKDVVQLFVRKNSQGRRGIVECAWKPERMYVGDRRGS